MATLTLSQSSNFLLGACALVYRPLTMPELEQLLVAAGKYMGKAWKRKHLPSALEELVRHDLLVVEGGRYHCSPDVADDACCVHLQGRTFGKLVAATRLAKLYPGGHRHGFSGNPDDLYRQFRLAIFEGEAEQARQLARIGEVLHRQEDFRIRMAFHLSFFQCLPEDSARELAEAALEECHFSCSYFESALDWLQEHASHSYTRYSLALLDFLRSQAGTHEFASLQAVELALADEPQAGLAKFDEAAQVLGHQPIPFLLPNTIWVLLLLREQRLQQAQDVAQRYARFDPKGQILMWLCRATRGLEHDLPPNIGPLAGPDLLIYNSCLYWGGFDKPLSGNRAAIEDWENGARQRGFEWVSDQLVDLLQVMDGKAPTRAWLNLFTPLQRWDRALKALERISVTAQESDKRLIWVLEESQSRISAQPKIQKKKSNGSWSPGRAADIYRLMRERPDYLDSQDVHTLSQISLSCWGHRNSDAVPLEVLQEHPRVFWEHDLGLPVEVLRGLPVLKLRKTDTGITLSLNTPYSPGRARTVVRETAQRLRVVCWEDHHQQLAEALGTEPVTFPLEQEESIGEVLRALSSHVSIDSNTQVKGQLQPADSRLWVDISPWKEGLQLDICVRPLGEQGPRLRPAEGGRLIASAGSQAERDLAAEAGHLQRIREICPGLGAEFSWRLDDTHGSLAQLASLQRLPERDFVLSWPQGRSLRLRNREPVDSMALQAREQRDWLGVSGELRVDEDLVLSFQQLLTASRQAEGRFVPLGEGDFLELTESFRRRLSTLARLGTATSREVKLPPLAAAIALEEENVEGPESWHKTRERLRQQPDHKAELPQGLKADLRDYQRVGFEWLARLAHWGLGACLADDMGLGKTVQALACLLTLQDRGPILVVAPTSVCGNWCDEARRFAPDLRLRQLGSDRCQTVTQLGAGDLLVVSYGLLVREEELLKEVQWAAVVLDEAQAIKNPRTQRARAAYRLRATFRLALSGTPVENQLQELWSMFRFLNPGLLGSLKQFKSRLASPIEKERDPRAAETLKGLVSPFLLRRCKKEVLTELPPRTDITVRVEMSGRELAFYESLRRNAVGRLAGQNKLTAISILAELTRLRQAACNPRLVEAESRLPSAKLEVFEGLLDDLMAGGHRALVFSQFVGHLRLVRQSLESRGITYQYLDGSTQAAQRRQRVQAFQDGQGAVFLISLRAGGTGLNLTGADYVVHLDPWWNPAVEDQASDRAHRIGQQKPVTVYRLMSADTIEERILALHQEKRELADRILSDTGSSPSLSAEELLRLLQH